MIVYLLSLLSLIMTTTDRPTESEDLNGFDRFLTVYIFRLKIGQKVITFEFKLK